MSDNKPKVYKEKRKKLKEKIYTEIDNSKCLL